MRALGNFLPFNYRIQCGSGCLYRSLSIPLSSPDHRLQGQGGYPQSGLTSLPTPAQHTQGVLNTGHQCVHAHTYCIPMQSLCPSSDRAWTTTSRAETLTTEPLSKHRLPGHDFSGSHAFRVCSVELSASSFTSTTCHGAARDGVQYTNAPSLLPHLLRHHRCEYLVANPSGTVQRELA